MYENCCKDSASALKSDKLNFGCSSNDSAFSIACEPEVTSSMEKDIASEIFKISREGFLFSAVIVERVRGFLCTTLAWSTLMTFPYSCAVSVNHG